MEKPCTKCGNEPRRPGQRWGKSCHAAHMRENRPSHIEMSDEARLKANARSYARSYLLRGKIERDNLCSACGRPGKLEMHHRDYSKPLEIKWLHRKCHLAHHQWVEDMKKIG